MSGKDYSKIWFGYALSTLKLARFNNETEVNVLFIEKSVVFVIVEGGTFADSIKSAVYI